jgi:hypothetical protein
MPKFRDLTEEEAMALARKKQPKAPSKRQIIREQYLEFLRSLKPGDRKAVDLEEGENRTTVKNRLIKAAEELGLSLAFERSKGAIIFQVLEKAGETEKTETT